MQHTVYFADRIVLFTETAPGEPFAEVRPAPGESVSRTKVLKILETVNFVAVVTPDADAAFGAFASGFRAVDAAGGAVVAPDGSRLMILRNGRWDLPKGHREPGESFETCAVREVEEETGVRAAIEAELCDTLHAYSLRGVWELKRTRWYAMRSAEATLPAPQTEEGITRAAWCDAQAVETNLKGTFPTIRRVFAALAAR